MEPVTVFLVAIACLLVAAAAVRPLARRTLVPEAVWLIGLGVGMRASGLVSTATIAALAPYFAAGALIIVLFEAGRDMVFGADDEQVGRARKLALAGAALVVPVVALFSLALSGLALLPTWSWTHALMLGAMVLCTAPEVFTPTVLRRAQPKVVATLERESALTGALAIALTAICIDLLSLNVGEGEALTAIATGLGLGLAFGAFAGLLWVTAIRRVGPGRGVYPYTLAGILGLYVVTDALGGIGALAVLVFGAVVSNAGPLVTALFRPRGAAVEAADEDFRAALDDHGRTVEITRVLLFTFIGLGLGPPWGLMAMGVVLGLLLVVLRLLAARLVLRGLPERDLAALALGWPRGVVVAGLAALPHAAAVPGTQSLTTLVFAAVATTCVAFAVAASHGAVANTHADDLLKFEKEKEKEKARDARSNDSRMKASDAAPQQPLPSVVPLWAATVDEVLVPRRAASPEPAVQEEAAASVTVRAPVVAGVQTVREPLVREPLVREQQTVREQPVSEVPAVSAVPPVSEMPSVGNSPPVSEVPPVREVPSVGNFSPAREQQPVGEVPPGGAVSLVSEVPSVPPVREPVREQLPVREQPASAAEAPAEASVLSSVLAGLADGQTGAQEPQPAGVAASERALFRFIPPGRPSPQAEAPAAKNFNFNNSPGLPTRSRSSGTIPFLPAISDTPISKKETPGDDGSKAG